MTNLAYIIETLFEHNGNDPLKFSTPITVRFSDLPFDVQEFYGLCVTPKNGLCIMTRSGKHGENEDWHKVEETEYKIIEAVKERVDKIYKTKVA